jgi:hypothetical protein
MRIEWHQHNSIQINYITFLSNQDKNNSCLSSQSKNDNWILVLNQIKCKILLT